VRNRENKQHRKMTQRWKDSLFPLPSLFLGAHFSSTTCRASRAYLRPRGPRSEWEPFWPRPSCARPTPPPRGGGRAGRGAGLLRPTRPRAAAPRCRRQRGCPAGPLTGIRISRLLARAALASCLAGTACSSRSRRRACTRGRRGRAAPPPPRRSPPRPPGRRAAGSGTLRGSPWRGGGATTCSTG